MTTKRTINYRMKSLNIEKARTNDVNWKSRFWIG